MRILHYTFTAALVVAFAIGCSKHPARVTDLGEVGFSEGTPQYFAVGDSKRCTITAKHTLDAMEVDFVIEATNTDGKVEVWATPTISTLPGQPCAYSFKDVAIKLTPKWKSP